MKISWTGYQSYGADTNDGSFNICYVQRAATPKVGQPVLRLLCSACSNMVFYICEKFQNNISNAFQLTERTQVQVEMAMFNVQKVITPKVGKSELQLMCSACRLTVCEVS